jgi:hypothetical protein
MTTQWITITPGRPVPTPRGVALLEALMKALSAAGRSVLRALEDSGQRRSARVLLEHARMCEGYDPERARLLREASRFDATGRGRVAPRP